MAAPTHILDTSALLAHYFDEPGAADVDAIWSSSESRPAICVLTIPELATRLDVEVGSSKEVERALGLYIDELTASVDVDRLVADEAVKLRRASPKRLPMVDACIAACAVLHDCLLVHRDPHLDQLPSRSVRQLRLPDRA